MCELKRNTTGPAIINYMVFLLMSAKKKMVNAGFATHISLAYLIEVDIIIAGPAYAFFDISFPCCCPLEGQQQRR